MNPSMRLNHILILLTFILSIKLATDSLAQDSLIDMLARTRQSMVTVTAYRLAGVVPQEPAAAIDPSSGRLILFQGGRVIEDSRRGAGVIVSPNGLIITNLHTIYGANKIAITLSDGKNFSAQIARLLPEDDLALLKINPDTSLTAISFADSDQLRLKDEVFNIGHSNILEKTFSQGLINGLGTSPSSDGRTTVELIQLRMNLYKGDSGGPVLNRQGQLIGIIAARSTTKDKAVYAIPSNKLKKLFLDLNE